MNAAKIINFSRSVIDRVRWLVHQAEEDGRREALAHVDRHLQTEAELNQNPDIKRFCAELRMVYETKQFRDAIPAGRDVEKVGSWPT